MKKLLLLTIYFLSIFQFDLQAQCSSPHCHVIYADGMNSFTPANQTIALGDTVVWINTGGFHNVNGGWATFPNNPDSIGPYPSSGLIGPGNLIGGKIFTVPGLYDYQCDPHVGMGMVGTILVNPGPVYPPEIDTVITTDVSCAGDLNGEATIYVNNPNLYAYDVALYYIGAFGPINVGNTYGNTSLQQTFPGMAAGDYCLVILDSNNNNPSDSACFTIYEPPVINISGIISPSLPAQATDIDVTISGGVGSYTYSWFGPAGFTANTEDISNPTGLDPGIYEVLVTDNNGCSMSDTFLVQQPPPPTASWDCGGPSGCFDPGGGTGQYATLIDCQKECCDAGTVDTNNVTCFLSSDGQIHIDNAWGEPPYTYRLDSIDPELPGYIPSQLDVHAIWVTTNTYHTFSDTTTLAFANYSLQRRIAPEFYYYTFTDGNGCKDIRSVEIDRDGDPFVVDQDIVLVSDTGLTDGSITLNVLQGGYPNTPNYHYEWRDSSGAVILSGLNSNILSSVGVGNYSVTISDDGIHACTWVIDPITISLAQPCAPVANITHNICPLDNQGSIQVNYLSGYNSYQFFDSLWNQLSSNSSFEDNLYSGIYYFALDSTAVCDDTTLILEVLEPVYLSDTTKILNAKGVNGNTLCANDSSQILIDFFIPDSIFTYTYQIRQNGSPIPPLGANVIGDTSVQYLHPGNYNIVLVNSTLTQICVNTLNLYPIEILEYNLAIDTLITTNETCGTNLGSILIALDSSNVSNMNPPFTYIIQNTASNTLNDTVNTNNFSYLFNDVDGPYDYNVIVSDSLGCPIHINGVRIEENVNISFTQTKYEKESCLGGDGVMEFVASGFIDTVDWKIWQGAVDILDTSVLWNPWIAALEDITGEYSEDNLDSSNFVLPLPVGTPVFNFAAGIYTVCVIDDEGCSYADTIEIENVAKPHITSIVRFPESCSGFDGEILTNINLGDGDTVIYTIRFDTTAIAIDTTLGLYPYMDGINVWPSQAFVDTFEISRQDTGYFTNLTRGYYKIKITDEYGCEDSVSYVNYQSGSSLINTKLPIDPSLANQLDMQISFTNMLCYDSINGTVKVLYPNTSYDYQLWLYNDTLNPNLIETDFSSSIDGLVYYNELYKGIYGVQAVSHSQYAGCVVKSDTFEILEPTVISYNSPLTTPSYCLNGGYANVGGACDGILWLPSTPVGGTVDTSSIASDTVYKYYINRVDSSINYFAGPFLTDSAFTGLCPGEYEVQVLDGNNCIIRDTVFLHDASLYIENFFVTNISCNDSSDASIEVFAYGGREPVYSYVWTDSISNVIDSSANSYVNNLVEGQYFVTVYDSTGCYAIDSAHIFSAPNQLELSAKRDEYGSLESCLAESYDGSIGFEIRGGTGPYIFNWVLNNGSVSGSTQANSIYCDTCTSYQNDNIIVDTIYVLDSLTTGFYNISLTDANGCKDTAWFPIDSLRILALNKNNPLIIDTITGVHNLCYGDGTGSIIIHINDSAMWPLSYSIDSGLTHQSDSLFNNLYADTFDILVVDGYGCKTTYSPFVINEYDSVIVSFDTVVHTSCYGNEDGFIEITISGGSAPYSTLWENPTTPTDSLNEDIYDLGVGTYTITCIDAIGCVALDSATIGSPDPIQLSASVISNVSCYGGSDGQAVVDTVLGGVSPYTYEWEDGVQDSVNTALFEGAHYCVVTDYSGCQDSIYVVIAQPDTALSIFKVVVKGNRCHEDSIGLVTLMASGGTSPYTFTNINNNNTLATDSITFRDLPEGEYSFSVEDNNGCTVDTPNVKVGGNDPIILTSTGFDLSCYKSEDGKLQIIFGDPIYNTAGGVAPYEYILTDTLDGSVLQEGDIYNRYDTLTIYNLNEGTYHLAVTDYYGCAASTTISISQPDSIYAKFDPVEALINRNESIQFANQSTPSAISIWNFGDGSEESNDNSPSHTYTYQGTYTVYLVANFDGQNDECGDTAFATIKVEGYDVDNVFTPNGDNINDVFHFHDDMLIELNVHLYNRWGIKVYHWEGPQGFWDGTGYNGELLPEGVYFFTMDAVGENGNSYTEKGSITLIR